MSRVRSEKPKPLQRTLFKMVELIKTKSFLISDLSVGTEHIFKILFRVLKTGFSRGELKLYNFYVC